LREYSDTGCKKAKLLGYDGPCLECPFEKCWEEQRMSIKTFERRLRIKELHKQGNSEKEIAKLLGMDWRTVRRALGGK